MRLQSTLTNSPVTYQVLIDFGTGAFDASTFVADTSVTAASLINIWIAPAATSNNTESNHWFENLQGYATDKVAGVGFTARLKCTFGRAHGVYSVAYQIN